MTKRFLKAIREKGFAHVTDSQTSCSVENQDAARQWVIPLRYVMNYPSTVPTISKDPLTINEGKVRLLQMNRS